MASNQTSRRNARRGPGRPAGRSADDGVLADRTALLEAAERLIAARGPLVTLEDIAAEAGVTKPILYRGVGGKDELVAALAERLVDRMTVEVSAMVAAAGGGRARVQALVSGYLQQAGRERHVYLYVTAGGNSDDRVHRSLLLADRTAANLSDGIAATRVRRGGNPETAQAWSYAVIGALHFVTLWWLREGATHTERIAEQITTLLWSGLNANEGATP